jgi:hypothetical protein
MTKAPRKTAPKEQKRVESPPAKTSKKVKAEAGKALKAGPTARERSLAGSVERHIEPRKAPSNNP